ncbi:MAG: SGNH/GDSL hydrolase family protein [Candidatus Nanopelagicales bacterium]
MATQSAPSARLGSPLIASARARSAAWSSRRATARRDAESDVTEVHGLAVAAAPILRPAHRRDPANHQWRRFVALGDSFTEGMNDFREDGSLVGWADRLARALAAESPDLLYANLAVRGNRVADVVDRQVDQALALQPDLVTLAIGINDMLRPKWDAEACVTGVEIAVTELRRAGVDVILTSFGDPRPRSRTLGAIARRVAAYGQQLRRIAGEQQTFLVDYWGVPSFNDERCWSSDRLHLSPVGHDTAARAALEVLGRGDGSWRGPLPTEGAAPTYGFVARRARDAAWFTRDVAPWATRKVVRSKEERSCRRPDYVRMGQQSTTSEVLGGAVSAGVGT